MRRLIFLFTGLLIFLASCKKGEIPVPKADRGTAITELFYLGDNYGDQIWYKLNGNRIVSKNPKYEWDLSFESGTNDYHVVMNSAKLMFAYNTHKQNLSDVMDTIGFSAGKRCDRVASLDSCVLGTYENSSPVYIIDLGMDDKSPPHSLGIKKLKFTSKVGSYSFSYANIDGSDSIGRYFSKTNNYNYNFLYFSFRDSILKSNIEPTKNEYDLEFTQYTALLKDNGIDLPYLVCGVLLNRHNVLVSRIENKTYEMVTLKDTLQKPMTNKLDAIGYDWKTYSQSTRHYSIVENNTYIIKDVEGYFYKLRFLSFVNNAGQKGWPKFEYQKL